MNKLAVIISPNYRDYAERYLPACLASLRAQSRIDFDLYLVDNESSDKSFALLSRLAPEAHIIRLDHNAGFAGGNNAALREILKADFEYVMLLNMDTRADDRALEQLTAALEEEPKAAAFQARLMMYPDQSIVNSLGNATHFLGFGYCLGYRSPESAVPAVRSDIAYPSGAAVLLRMAALRQVGLFDEEMWMYNEDQDMGWRLWLAGWTCRLEPSAVVYHHYEFSRSIAKYYWMDRNRIIAIIKNYEGLTLALVAPAFILMEIGLLIFSLKTGWWRDKLRVWAYFLKPRTWRYLQGARREIQSARLISDAELSRLIVGTIWYQEVDDVKLRLINPVFALYWKAVKSLIKASRHHVKK